MPSESNSHEPLGKTRGLEAIMAGEQLQQLRRQRFSGFGQSEKCNDSAGDGGRFPTPRRPKTHANAAVLNFKYSRILNQALSGHWQFGWPAEQSNLDEKPENLLEHCQAWPPVSDEIAGD
jgi:hypothetical protein